MEDGNNNKRKFKERQRKAKQRANQQTKFKKGEQQI